MKPIYKIILFAIVLVAIAALIYIAWQLFAIPKLEPRMPETPPSGGELPILPVTPGDDGGGFPLPGPPADGTEDNISGAGASAVSGFTKISDQPAFDAWSSTSTGDIYYITPEGLVSAAKDGPDLELSTQPLQALNRIEPSRDGTRILASFGDPRAPEWKIFDVRDRAWRPLTPGIVSATWGFSSSDAYALVDANGERSIQRFDFSKPPFATSTVLKGVPLRDVDLLGWSARELFIIERPSFFTEGRVWKVDLISHAVNLLFSPQAGLLLGGAQDRSAFFMTNTAGEFRILTPALTEKIPVLFSTFPDKCGGTASTVFCFVPRDIPITPRPILPDDYLSHSLETVDMLYRMDIGTGDIDVVPDTILKNIAPVNASRVGVVGPSLFLVNRYDNGLYRAIIK